MVGRSHDGCRRDEVTNYNTSVRHCIRSLAWRCLRTTSPGLLAFPWERYTPGSPAKTPTQAASASLPARDTKMTSAHLSYGIRLDSRRSSSYDRRSLVADTVTLCLPWRHPSSTATVSPQPGMASARGFMNVSVAPLLPAALPGLHTPKRPRTCTPRGTTLPTPGPTRYQTYVDWPVTY
jgi:hypothetical protein